MNRMLAMASRNRREMLRDPLSYMFCLAFPLVMLGVMTLIDRSVPAEANLTIFHIENLAPGIAVFGQAFLMLFAALNLSRDRSCSFLVRLYATPMQSKDFILGYLLPMLIIGILQNVVLYLASLILAAAIGTPLNAAGLLLSLLALIPSAVLFISIGLLAGTLFSEKGAPGLCSVIISLSSFLGCIWFDADSVGGVLLKACKVLPFYYCTKAGRSALIMDLGKSSFLIPVLIVTGCAAALCLLSAAVFRTRMRADLA